jgi:hypothetical protein
MLCRKTQAWRRPTRGGKPRRRRLEVSRARLAICGAGVPSDRRQNKMRGGLPVESCCRPVPARQLGGIAPSAPAVAENHALINEGADRGTTSWARCLDLMANPVSTFGAMGKLRPDAAKAAKCEAAIAQRRIEYPTVVCWMPKKEISRDARFLCRKNRYGLQLHGLAAAQERSADGENGPKEGNARRLRH